MPTKHSKKEEEDKKKKEAVEKATESVEAAIQKLESDEVEVTETHAEVEQTEEGNSEDTVEEKEEELKEDQEKEEKVVSESATEGTVFSKQNFQEEKSGGSKKGLIIVIICLCVIFTIFGFIGGYFYGQSALESVKSSVTPTPTTEATPTPTPSDEVDLSAYTIQILNGAGVGGIAGEEEETLNGEGFNVIDTGNADSSNYTETEISAKAGVLEEYINELTSSLSERYVVSSDIGELDEDSTFDVVIILGSDTVE